MLNDFFSCFLLYVFYIKLYLFNKSSMTVPSIFFSPFFATTSVAKGNLQTQLEIQYLQQNTQ